ncbi:MAG TPA: ricin-type beta-trefoil lectin domain protein, partial [Streptosporangiaceae bacterium]
APAHHTYPAQYPYRHARDFYDVTSVNNGKCEYFRSYLCNGKPGYDGPTGLGTPNGTAGFSNAGAQQVTLVDPGTQDAGAGRVVSLRIRALDVSARATSLDYTATGLPSGLSVASVPGSLDGLITGTLPATAATATVTLAAKDAGTGQIGRVTFRIVSTGSLLDSAPASGHVTLGWGGPCLTASALTAGSAVTTATCDNQLATQVWSYLPGGAPGDPGTMTVNGMCLSAAASQGSQATVSTCDSSSSQEWQLLGFGLLQNRNSGLCLTQVSASSQAVSEPCGNARQGWQLPAGHVLSGVGGLCLGWSGSYGSSLRIRTCTTDPRQQWSWTARGVLQVPPGGWCVDIFGRTDGSPIQVGDACYTPTGSGSWIAGPGGELINAYTGKCLADPGTNGPGTALAQEDCYGEAGEIWALN